MRSGFFYLYCQIKNFATVPRSPAQWQELIDMLQLVWNQRQGNV